MNKKSMRILLISAIWISLIVETLCETSLEGYYSEQSSLNIYNTQYSNGNGNGNASGSPSTVTPTNPLLTTSLSSSSASLSSFESHKSISSDPKDVTLQQISTISTTIEKTSAAGTTTLSAYDSPPNLLNTHTSNGAGSDDIIIESESPHPHIPKELLGCGPNNMEAVGIQKALDWLREKRSPDYSWENDTHMVILAKELSNAREPFDPDGHLQIISDLEDLLSIKQMEIEIMNMLDEHHTLPKPLNTNRVARYILSLGSLCKDPRQFNGHDLVSAMLHHEPSQDHEFALATLAACSAATHVRKRQIRRLLDIASGEVNNIDTMSMVLLALRCIVTDHRHRHLQHFIRRPARGLATLQGPKGSFGSLRSTALAIQALQDLELDPAGSWNRTAASVWILERQRSDGGWTEEPLQDGQDASVGVGLTADIILALGCKGLGAVRALQCDHVMQETNGEIENGEPKLAQPIGLAPVAEESESKNVTFTYTLWFESNITDNCSLTLTSPKNTSFFKAMTQAADLDPRFAFDAREWPNGHYVHTLSSKKEEPTLYHYWLLYRLPEFPDPKSPPGNQLIAPVGVDELIVEDGEHYLYWYKKL